MQLARGTNDEERREAVRVPVVAAERVKDGLGVDLVDDCLGYVNDRLGVGLQAVEAPRKVGFVLLLHTVRVVLANHH